MTNNPYLKEIETFLVPMIRDNTLLGLEYGRVGRPVPLCCIVYLAKQG